MLWYNVPAGAQTLMTTFLPSQTWFILVIKRRFHNQYVICCLLVDLQPRQPFAQAQGHEQIERNVLCINVLANILSSKISRTLALD